MIQIELNIDILGKGVESPEVREFLCQFRETPDVETAFEHMYFWSSGVSLQTFEGCVKALNLYGPIWCERRNEDMPYLVKFTEKLETRAARTKKEKSRNICAAAQLRAGSDKIMQPFGGIIGDGIRFGDDRQLVIEKLDSPFRSTNYEIERHSGIKERFRGEWFQTARDRIWVFDFNVEDALCEARTWILFETFSYRAEMGIQ